MKDGESAAKISSVCGANRKRKWTEEEEDEEEQKAEESSDLDTSSDDDNRDDVQEDEKEANKPVCSSHEEKPEVMKEEELTEKVEQNEERKTDQSKIQTNQKPSQPVVFVPVDRLPEIQVCAHVKVSKRNETNNTTLSPGRSNICLPFGFIWCVDVGGSAEAACAGRGAGHHGGSSRKSLRRYLWRNRKWKNNPSASVSV